MLREIKFRVYWNDKMVYDNNCDFVVCKGEPRLNEHGDMIGLGGVSSLMQYTGLKDKNGVEIYEGDILTLSLDTKASFYKPSFYMVKYEKNTFVLDGELSTFKEAVYFEEREVIGNIYENHELLEIK